MNEEQSTEPNFSLCNRNKKIKVTESCNNKHGLTHFTHKMIGRRVVWGVQNLTYFESTHFLKVHLAALLRHGSTYYDDKFDERAIYSTNLGLEVVPSAFRNVENIEPSFIEEDDYGNKYIMEEEEQWIVYYAKTATFFKGFIKEQYGKCENSFKTNLLEPYDLTDFKKYIQDYIDLKKLKIDTIKKELIKEVKKSSVKHCEKVFMEFFNNTQ